MRLRFYRWNTIDTWNTIDYEILLTSLKTCILNNNASKNPIEIYKNRTSCFYVVNIMYVLLLDNETDLIILVWSMDCILINLLHVVIGSINKRYVKLKYITM